MLCCIRLFALFLKPFSKTDFKRFPERNNFEGKIHLSVENRFDLSLLDTSAHNPFRTMPLYYKSIYLRHLTNEDCLFVFSYLYDVISDIQPILRIFICQIRIKFFNSLRNVQKPSVLRFGWSKYEQKYPEFLVSRNGKGRITVRIYNSSHR